MCDTDPEKSSFIDIRERNGFYIDKSLPIMDIIDRDDSGVYLFTRPSGFGKTMNITMLDAFLNIRYRGNTWFDGLGISDQPDCECYKNVFPVVYLDLGTLRCTSVDDFMYDIASAIIDAIDPLMESLDPEELTVFERSMLERLYARKSSRGELKCFISTLCPILERHYKAKVVILIDDYDHIIRESIGTGVGDDISNFMSGFLSSTLKSNFSLQMAYVTGEIQMILSGLFSGLNNMTPNNIQSSWSDDRFGFTEDEVWAVLDRNGRTDGFDDVWKRYGGYRFGDAEVCDPAGVMSYISEGTEVGGRRGRLELGPILRRSVSDACVAEDTSCLLNGQTIVRYIHDQITYEDLISSDECALYSLMAMTGYLRIIPDEGSSFRISVPNSGVMEVLRCTLDGNNQAQFRVSMSDNV